jgi:hypothetical protein
MNSKNNLLDNYMFKLCSDQRECFDYCTKLKDYLNSQSDYNFNGNDIIKLCEILLLFVKSDQARNEIDSLIVIMVFIQRLTYLLKDHLEKSCLLHHSYYIILSYFFLIIIFISSNR